MARFNDAWMDSLLAKNDIVSVVSSYVSLRSKGRKMWGLCPFHHEKTPSFCVTPDKQMFYCFGCGAGGGIVQFIMQIERLQFVEAVEFLARRAGMELPETVNDEELRRERAHKERLFEACRLAAKYYNSKLLSDEGKAAQKYLSGRGLGAQEVQRFGLGFAPESWNGLLTYLTDAGFSENELLDAGLVNTKSGRVYDAYRNRVVFPIIGTDLRVMGFGARTMGNDLPKYINTSDTPIYNKRRCLYALNSVKNERISDIVVVEGYMDVISLYAAGINNAVASLGTSLTAQQARLIKRYASNVYIAYDGDAAGQNATLRGLDILSDEGLRVKVIVMPEGKDPDDFVRQNGGEEFIRLKDKALTLSEFKLKGMAQKYDLLTEDGRQEYAIEACKFIASLQPVERERYHALLSRHTGISVEALREQEERESVAVKPTAPGPVQSTRRRRVRYTSERQLLEQSLLYAAVSSPEYMNRLREHNLDELFSTEAYREFARLTLEVDGEAKKPDPVLIMSSMTEEHAGLIAEMLGKEEKITKPEQYISDCVERILRADAMTEIQDLQSQIDDETVPLEERLELVHKITELKKRL